MVGIAGKLAESEMFVECARRIVLGVNRKCSNPGDVGGLKRP